MDRPRAAGLGWSVRPARRGRPRRRGRLRPGPPRLAGAATAVWTGREVLVVGGIPAVRTDQDRRFTDGAAYDPARDTWRRLAPSPQPRGSLMAQHLAWTGARLLVWSDW